MSTDRLTSPMNWPADIGVAEESTAQTPEMNSGLGPLTRTQREILAMVAQGLTNSRIADVRGISKKTVEMHIKNIYDAMKIEVTTDQNARVLAAIRFTLASGPVLSNP